MFELERITNNTYYIENPAKVGLYVKGDDHVCLIDSGHDRNAGKRILGRIRENGWTLDAVYLTHSHADHSGGAMYLKEETGCRVFAPGIEAALTSYTLIEPAYLYGGYPPEELRGKFLLPEASCAEILTENDLPDGFRTIDLPGHFFGMNGYITPDGVAFLADSVLSKRTCEKYQIGYFYDIAAALETLRKIKRLDCSYYVPSHAELTQNISELADINISKIIEVGNKIEDLCSGGRTTEMIVKSVFDDFGLKINFEQYALISSTTKSYLTWLKNQGRVKTYFADNILYWEKTNEPA